MEAKIEELLEYYTGALDLVSDAIGMSTPGGTHWYQNKAFDNLFGDIGQDPPSSVYADEQVGRDVFQTIMSGREWAGLVTMRGKEGRLLKIILHAYPIKDENENVISLVGIHTDITKKQQDREVLHLQHDLSIALSGVTNLEEALILIVDAACKIPDMDCGGVYLVNQDSKDIDLVYSKGLFSEFVKKISHYNKNSDQAKIIASGKAIFADYSQLKISKDPVKQKEKLRAIAIIPILHQGKAIGALNVGSHSINSISSHTKEHLETIASRVGSAIVRVIIEEKILKQNRELQLLSQKLRKEINDHKRTEETLKFEKDRFRVFSEESPFGISMIAKDGRWLYINPKFLEMFGYDLEDIPTGKEWFQKAFPDRDYRENAISIWIKDQKDSGTGEVRPRTFTTICKNKVEKMIHFRPVTLESRHQLVFFEDVTERNRLERRLQQTQKIEAIGSLAGGVAHDFNNLLMGIQGRVSLMSTELNFSHPHIEHLNAIGEYIQSATDLTQQLLGIARGGKYELKPININELVTNSASMFGRTKKEIRIHTRMLKSSPTVVVDRRQIEQVLLNLFINAWHAMPDTGDLYLEIKAVDLDEEYCKSHQAKPGRYAKVSVTDTGIGMHGDVLQQIFDPFFTTKGKGRGTGLGLASAYGIVKNHNGIITVYSELGQGTTFNIYLPLSEQDAYREAPSEGDLVQGSETILLVDDEEMIIDVGKAMLERLGYRVYVAVGGVQAVETISNMGDKIDLVVLDMIMPGIDGSETFNRIREIYPNLLVILSSGYSINGRATEILSRGCNGFIQKPFNIFELSQKVRNVLDEAAFPPKKT